MSRGASRVGGHGGPRRAPEGGLRRRPPRRPPRRPGIVAPRCLPGARPSSPPAPSAFPADRVPAAAAIHSSGTSEVYPAITAGGANVAVKRTKITCPNDIARFEKEVELLHGCDHPCIIRPLGVVRAPRTCALVLPLHPRGWRFRLLHSSGRTLARAAAAAICADVAAAVAHLHERHVVHRDIKTDNVLVSDSSRCVLTDFNAAEALERIAADIVVQARPSGGFFKQFVVGTLPYMAPELLRSVRGAAFTPACDVFSLAILANEVLTATVPYADALCEQVQLQTMSVIGEREAEAAKLKVASLEDQAATLDGRQRTFNEQQQALFEGLETARKADAATEVLAGELQKTGRLGQLKQRVAQRPLPDAIVRAILVEVDTQQRLQALLTLLEQVISFVCVAVGGGSAEAPLHDYATQVLLLSDEAWRDASTPTIEQQVRLCHLQALFMALEHGAPQSVDDELHERYKEPLPPGADALLDDPRLRRAELLPALHDLIVSQLADGAWQPGLSLKEYLGYADADLADAEWYEAAFPYALELRHTCACYVHLRARSAAAPPCGAKYACDVGRECTPSRARSRALQTTHT